MMTNTPTIDITHIPQLRRVIEEMQTSKQPRLLAENSQPVALLMPLGTMLNRQEPGVPKDIWAAYHPQKVKAALAKSSGALAGVDTVRLLKDIHEARSQE